MISAALVDRLVVVMMEDKWTTGYYHENELTRVLSHGPHPDEDFFRLQVKGIGHSRTLNITGEELGKIAAILGERDG